MKCAVNKIHCLLTGTYIEISEELSKLLENKNEDLFKRRSRLYIPLICEEFVQKSRRITADGLIFDLEDSVPPELKSRARGNIKKIPPKKRSVEHILRINAHQTDLWKEDLNHLNTYPFDTVMIPKVESPRQIEEISSRFRHSGLKRLVLIETIQGLWNVREIASALGPGDAMGYGAGDLSASFGISREPIHESIILQQALMQVLMAAKHSGVDVFDPPFRDFTDIPTLRKEAEFGHKCGTIGKQAVHPSQLEIINSVYSPSDTEIDSYVSELGGFAKNRHRQAIKLNGEYRGKPSKVLAEQKLCDFLRRGYINLIRSEKFESIYL
jgi:citrate lyase subunit beta/citryl-CoA lyase